VPHYLLFKFSCGSNSATQQNPVLSYSSFGREGCGISDVGAAILQKRQQAFHFDSQSKKIAPKSAITLTSSHASSSNPGIVADIRIVGTKYPNAFRNANSALRMDAGLTSPRKRI
jgi:hypothetical protein